MFTGIINNYGIVKNIENDLGDKIFEIESNLDAESFVIGASICHDGVCLTVIKKQKITNDKSIWKVQASTHTLALTNLDAWEIGRKINIEPSLKFGDEIGGHMVSGHVDGIGQIVEIEKIHESTRIKVKAPDELTNFIATKGSIAIDGVSLTVNEVSKTGFCVNIIEHTLKNTNIASYFVGSIVNLEIDPIARYVARYLEQNKN
jgi:riboflavin synthase